MSSPFQISEKYKYTPKIDFVNIIKSLSNESKEQITEIERLQLENKFDEFMGNRKLRNLPNFKMLIYRWLSEIRSLSSITEDRNDVMDET